MRFSSPLVRALPAALALAALPVVLSGCILADIARKPQSFTAIYGQQVTQPGTVTSEPPGQTVRGEVVKGPFTAKLAKPVSLSARKKKSLKLKVGGGTYVAKVDGTENFSTQVATATGLELVTFKDKATGSICAQVTFTTNNHGQSYTGTFKSLGGTGNAARARISGTFTETPGQNNAVTMNGSASGSSGKRKGLTTECKALRSL